MALDRSHADPVAGRLCREFFLKMRLADSRPLSKARPEICGKRKLVVELIRSGQRGCAEKRLAGGDVGARGDMDHFPGSFVRGGMKAEEMMWEVHRDDFRRGLVGYRRVTAIG